MACTGLEAASAGIARWMPGLTLLRRYKRAWLTKDMAAGLSVAAIALPVGIAYADLTGVPAAIGIYSAIFPLWPMPFSVPLAS